MTTFVLIPGAGGAGWYWSRVAPLLREAGHTAIAIDLPADDETAGLPEYADLVVRAAEDAPDVVLVAQSMGGFTALMAQERIVARALVFLNAMIPLPGESPGAWFETTATTEAQQAAARAGGYSETYDDETYFFHDVPADVIAAGEGHDRPEADIAFRQPCTYAGWPEAPVTVLAGRDDRFFPLAFQRRLAHERFGIDVTEVPGGHLAALSEPAAVTRALLDSARSA